ncbi:MAG: nitroreductase, partial [Nitratireductor sp.]|nr:nitroreductase [Nitratireductor sp.]
MSGPGPSDAEMETMIAIASRVPDHGKLAPWRFIRYAPAYAAKLNEICLARALARDPALPEDLRAFERNRFTKTPVVIAIVSRPQADHPKVPVWEQQLSCGAAAMNLLIAANALGYDAQWLTEWVAFDEELAPALGVREGERLAGFAYI